MDPCFELLISLIFAGFVGWVSARLMNVRVNVWMAIAIGLVGGLLGRAIGWAIGLEARHFIGSFILATIGSVLLIALARQIRKR